MAEFGGHKSTKAGQNLQATLFATKRPLQYSSVKVGDGQLAGKVIADLTSLVKVRLSLPITQTPRKNQDGRWDITAVLSNREITEPMKFREWGVFATDPDTNAEVLIAYANAGESADILNPWDGTTVSTLIEQEITCACLVTGDLTVQAITVDPTQLYTTRQVFDAHNIDMGHHLIPCIATYDTTTKRHTLTPTQTGITLPDIFTARFLATTAFTAGDKVYIGGAEYIPSYTDGDTAVETGVWIVGAVVSLDCKKAGLKAYVGAGFGKQLSHKANLVSAYINGDITNIPLKSGAYYIGAAVTGKPFEGECLANVVADGTTATIYTYKGNIVYRRFGTGGVWQPWMCEATATPTQVLTLLNGWTYAENYDGYQPKAFITGNTLTVNGLIIGGVTATSTVICYLPVNFKPSCAVTLSLPCLDASFIRLLIQIDGSVLFISGSSASPVFFNFSFGGQCNG